MTMWQKKKKYNNINNNEKIYIIHTLDTTQTQLYWECEQTALIGTLKATQQYM